MIYYAGLVAYILGIYGISQIIKDENKRRIIFFIFACLGVILFQGFRAFSVGCDLDAYIPWFTEIAQSRWNDIFNVSKHMEPGYVILNKILSVLFGSNERLFLISISIIIHVPIFFVMYKYSKDSVLSVLYYFAFGEFIFTFSGLRQSIAMSLCFLGYVFIKNRKLIFFILITILAATFHKSALICLILYPIYYFKTSKKFFIIFIIISVFAFIFRKHIFTLASSIFYSYYTSIDNTGAYTMFLIYSLIYIFSMLFYFYNKQEDTDYIGFTNILYLVLFIYIFASVNNVITRLAFPFELYLTLYFPILVNKINLIPRWLFLGVCYIALIVCFLFKMVGSMETLPFSFAI